MEEKAKHNFTITKILPDLRLSFYFQKGFSWKLKDISFFNDAPYFSVARAIGNLDLYTIYIYNDQTVLSTEEIENLIDFSAQYFEKYKDITYVIFSVKKEVMFFKRNADPFFNPQLVTTYENIKQVFDLIKLMGKENTGRFILVDGSLKFVYPNSVSMDAFMLLVSVIFSSQYFNLELIESAVSKSKVMRYYLPYKYCCHISNIPPLTLTSFTADMGWVILPNLLVKDGEDSKITSENMLTEILNLVSIFKSKVEVKNPIPSPSLPPPLKSDILHTKIFINEKFRASLFYKKLSTTGEIIIPKEFNYLIDENTVVSTLSSLLSGDFIPEKDTIFSLDAELLSVNFAETSVSFYKNFLYFLYYSSKSNTMYIIYSDVYLEEDSDFEYLLEILFEKHGKTLYIADQEVKE